MNTSPRSGRRQFLTTLALAVITTAAVITPNAHAYDETSTQAVNVDASGLALKGHDPVAYFVVGAATPGLPTLAAKHAGATYRFASQANLDAFVKAPDKYVPAYGGFCAMGVALEKKLDVDLQAWRIVDGKLYLNLNKDVQKRWLSDVPAHLQQAQANWPRLKNAAPKDL